MMDEFLFSAISLLLLGLKTNGLALPRVDRIVNGEYVSITKVSYMLSLSVNSEYICGAAIINEDWAVTAAHCIILFVNDSVSINIRSGSNKYDSGGIVHNVTTLLYHEKYNELNNDYDIGLLKVSPPFKFDNATEPVKLPGNESIYTSWASIAGWGYFIDIKPILSKDLKYVTVPKVSKEQCRKDYKGRYEVTEHQVCYGFSQGGKDACKGDSGSPLVNRDNIIIGITSWGDDCGQPYSPGVYTDVIDLVDWIKNKTMSTL